MAIGTIKVFKPAAGNADGAVVELSFSPPTVPLFKLLEDVRVIKTHYFIHNILLYFYY